MKNKLPNEQLLLVDLQGQEYSVVANVAKQFSSLPQQNVRDFLKFFQSMDISSTNFQAFQALMSQFEGAVGHTYFDGEGNITIGIGLNLANPEAEAVIIAVNQKFGTSYSYSDLSTLPVPKPSKDLTYDQVSYMFYLSLIGVTEQRPDGSTVTFSGELNALISKLATAGLDNTPFAANQLASLLSLAFNSPTLIGENLLEALTGLSQAPTDLIALENVLVEIGERSNKYDKDSAAGVANRRVMEAGVFLGSADKIHMSHRAVQAVLAVDPDRPLNGEDRYALPTGEVEKTWEGGATAVTEDGTDASHYNKITYGSTQADKIPVDTSGNGSKVVLGGDGDDQLTLTAADSPTTAGAHYLAGNKGWDSYHIADNVGKVMIVDSDNRGVIVTPTGRTMVGLAESTGTENIYSLDGNSLKLVAAATNSESASPKLQADFGQGTYPVEVMDYQPGGFGLVYGGGLKQVNAKGSLRMLSNGLFATVSNTLDTPPLITIQIVDINGQVIKSTQFAAPSLQLESAGLIPGEDGGLCVIYVKTFQGQDTDTVYANIFYQTFDQNLTALSGEQLIQVLPGSYQISGASMITASGQGYVFAYNVVQKVGQGNIAHEGLPSLGLQLHMISAAGELVVPPQMVYQHSSGATYIPIIVNRHQGGILLYAEETGVHDSSRIGIFDASLNLQKTVALPARLDLIGSAFADIADGFLACLKPTGSTSYQLAVYQLNQDLQLFPVPLQQMDNTASFWGINDEYVFAIVGTSSLSSKGMGVILNLQGQVVLNNLDIGEVGIDGCKLRLQDNGDMRLWGTKGIFIKTKYVMDLKMSGFSLAPGQQVFSLTDVGDEACRVVHPATGETHCSIDELAMDIKLMPASDLPLVANITQELPLLSEGVPPASLMSAIDENFSSCKQDDESHFHCEHEQATIEFTGPAVANALNQLPGHLALGILAGFNIRKLFWCFQNWRAGLGFQAEEPAVSREKQEKILESFENRLSKLSMQLDMLVTRYAGAKIQDDAGIMKRIDHAWTEYKTLQSQEKIRGSEVRRLGAIVDSVESSFQRMQFAWFENEGAIHRGADEINIESYRQHRADYAQGFFIRPRNEPRLFELPPAQEIHALPAARH
ncbi:MAG: hypothetical protein K0S08_1592 [Gammaproteobacteria bacterium]|jgi:hypothetical protein|nr:hypothetical protein [Gammaproteobacteria bacterium]